MAYTKQTWTNGVSKLNATRMQHIEDGLEAAASVADTAEADAQNALQETIFDAKGDLIVASAADTAARLAAGVNDRLLVTDSAQSVGLKYAQLTDAMVASAAAIARSKLATQTIRVPIQLNTPQVSANAGNAFWTVLGQTDWDFGHWEFVKDVKGKVYGTVTVPKNLAGTPAAKIKLVIAANATTGVTRLNVGTKDVADGESLNPTLTDETAQDITVPATAYLRKDVSFTLTNAPAADDILIVEVFHEGDHANDTLAVNTLLLGAYLECDVA
jgi:hypothetical protein